MDEQWINSLKERSRSYQRRAPQGLWEGIEQRLAKPEPRRRATIVAPWWRRWAAVSAAVLALATIGTIAIMHQQPMEQSTEQSTAATTTAASDQHTEEITAATATPSGTAARAIITHPQIIDKNDDVEVVAADTATVEAATIVPPTREKREPEPTESRPSVFDQMAQHHTGSRPAWEGLHGNAGDKQQRQGSRWSAGLFASNMGGENNTSTGFRTFTQGADPFSVHPKEQLFATAMGNIMLNTIDEETTTDINHHLPIRVGATARYALTDRWGIESGLTYTLLRSDLTSGGERDYYTTRQTLHYLGIPLRASYTVWHTGRFKLYVAAGGTMDIPLQGRAVTSYVNDGQLVERTTDDARPHRLQWSASGAAGAQYTIADRLAIYAEPGMSYYFDDGSPLLTVYKDKPLNFSLQIGLRIELE